jgi:hypothetical protein
LAQGREIHVDIRPDKGLERLKTDDAGLCYACAQIPRDLESCLVKFPHLKISLEVVNRDEAAGFRESGAFRLTG